MTTLGASKTSGILEELPIADGLVRSPDVKNRTNLNEFVRQ
jgi:hypothetical protein